MRIAVFTDIHGNLQALEAILKDIKEEKVDKVICLGDIVGIGPEPRECLDLIMNSNVEMLLGNHELYYLKGVEIEDERDYEKRKHYKWVSEELSSKHREFLEKCKFQIVIANVLFEHFLMKESDYIPFHKTTIIDDPNLPEILKQIKEDYIFIGHEHLPFELEENGKRLIDQGSSGCTHDDNTSYLIVDINDEVTWHKKSIKYDYSELKRVFKRTDYPVKDFYEKTFF